MQFAELHIVRARGAGCNAAVCRIEGCRLQGCRAIGMQVARYRIAGLQGEGCRGAGLQGCTVQGCMMQVAGCSMPKLTGPGRRAWAAGAGHSVGRPAQDGCQQPEQLRVGNRKGSPTAAPRGESSGSAGGL